MSDSPAIRNPLGRRALACAMAALLALSLIPGAAAPAAYADQGDSKAGTSQLAAAVLADGELSDDPALRLVGTDLASLQAMVDSAAPGATATVKVQADIEFAKGQTLDIPAGKAIVLDMGGHSFTVAADYVGRPVVNAGTLTVMGDGVIDGTASRNGGYGAILNDASGILTIKDGTFRGSFYAGGSPVKNLGTATVDGGTFEGAVRAFSNEGTATLNGGRFLGTSCSACDSANWSYTVYSAGSITVNDAQVVGTQGGLAIAKGDAVVNGGSFLTQPCSQGHDAVFYALYVAGERDVASCEVNGGTFETTGPRSAVLIGNDNTGGDGGINADAFAVINGGTFVAQPGVAALTGAPSTGNPKVLGGAFSSDVSAYVPAATHEVSLVSGAYQVLPFTAQTGGASVTSGGTVTYVRDLDAALEAAASGDTITLLRDADGSGHGVVDLSGITLDLGGFDLKAGYMKFILQGTGVVLRNGTISGGSESYSLWIGDEGTTDGVTIQNVSVPAGINIYNAANVLLKDVSAQGRDYYAVWLDENAQAIIDGGSFTGGANAQGDAMPVLGMVRVKDGVPASSLTVKDGTFTAKDGKLVLTYANAEYYTPVLQGGTYIGVPLETVQQYAGEGFEPEASADGTVVVRPLEPEVPEQPSQPEAPSQPSQPGGSAGTTVPGASSGTKPSTGDKKPSSGNGSQSGTGSTASGGASAQGGSDGTLGGSDQRTSGDGQNGAAVSRTQDDAGSPGDGDGQADQATEDGEEAQATSVIDEGETPLAESPVAESQVHGALNWMLYLMVGAAVVAAALVLFGILAWRRKQRDGQA